MSNELTILGAAYGKADVTEKIKSLGKDQKLSITACNSIFGDTWRGRDKSLVVVYKYGDEKPQLRVVKEGDTLEIMREKSDVSVDSVREESEKLSSKLSILGAAYGLSDVTETAKRFVTANQDFNQLSTDVVWGNSWPDKKKTLVVVYEYSGICMIEIAVEEERMQIIVSPPLTILGAAYGLLNVTARVKELVKNHSLRVKADNTIFDDGWKGKNKTLVVVYQYGKEVPSVAVVKEGNEMRILYSRKQEYRAPTNPRALVILGAAYGPVDVTSNVQSLIKSGSNLDVSASNSVFGDTWHWNRKSLVVVYQYGENSLNMFIVPEHSTVTLSRQS